MVEKNKGNVWNLSSSSNRKEVIGRLLEKDFRETNHDRFVHFLKAIDRKYIQKREKWAERLYEIEDLGLPRYNDRIYWLIEDGIWSYVFGLPRATIMYLSLAAEQIIKNIYLKSKNYSKDSYNKIEGENNKKGLTFGSILKLIKSDTYLNRSLENVLPLFEKINTIRNKSYGHQKFTGLLTNENNELFQHFLLYLRDICDNIDGVKQRFEKRNILSMIYSENLDLVYEQPKIEWEIDIIIAKEMIKTINEVHNTLDKSLIDRDKFSMINDILEGYL